MKATAVYAEYVSLRPGVYLAANERVLFLSRAGLPGHSEPFGAPCQMKHAVLDRLAQGPCTTAELLAVGVGEDGGVAAVLVFLDALRAGGWLVTTVRSQGRDLYSMQPLRALCRTQHPAGRDLVLSRFAVLRREGDRFVVESPLARARMQVHDARVLAIVGALERPTSDQPARSGLRGWVVRDMVRAGLVVPDSAEAGRDTRQWRPHELWFHASSRMGGGGYSGVGFGRTFWAKPLYEPVPARRPAFPGPVVDLYRPDLEALRASDSPLTAVMEDRRSIRAHDDGFPVTLDQLGELLYRCARVRRSFTRDGLDYVSRPHPSGGSAYELELYPVVRLVAGLEPGMYHYDPHEHRLRLVREPGPPVTRLLRAARSSAAMPAPPQVLIVVAARFGRLMYMYEELPYSLILKHVGVLYQTMYLVATSMGLAACGLGAGDAMAFTEATGLDYVTESSVGEFVLGSRCPE